MTFQEALESGDIDAIKIFPKSDLHNHSVLGGSRDFLAELTGREIPVLREPLLSMADMHEWVNANLAFLFSEPAGRLKCIEASFVQAKRDGVTRVELGDDVWAATLFDNSAANLSRCLRELHAQAAPDVEWIPQISISRHCGVPAILSWMEPFLGLGLYRTIDLSGDEFSQPIENFRPIYQRAKAAGLRLKAHVGEWGDADSVWRAVEELELDEVQHGIAAANSPQVMRLLRDNGIRLNICPTSNVMLGRTARLEIHPIRRLYDAGIRVTVNTDDALVFGTSVSEEYLKLYRCGLFGASELDAIRMNGLSD